MSVWVGALVLSLTLVATGCATRDDFPMRNLATGQEVICHSGWYWGEEGAPQMRILEQCGNACNRYGIRRLVDAHYEGLSPHDPDEDVKPFIPSECLP
jgi:hypothetical protein